MICTGLLIVGLPAVLWLGMTLRRLSPAFVHAEKRSLSSLWHDRRGTATIEFTLVFPILLFLIMLLTQSTLLMGATIICNHAAFAATRAAVVIIPLNYPQRDEPFNTIHSFNDSYKTARIRKAAVMAVLPAAGRLETPVGDLDPEQLVTAMHHYYASHDMQAPLWVDTHLPEKLNYADAHTEVTILRTRVMDGHLYLMPVQGSYTFGPRDPVTVRVNHRMNLAVPYVGLIFADGRNASSLGGSLYTNIVSQCTLPNEGIINQLPPRPTLPRR